QLAPDLPGLREALKAAERRQALAPRLAAVLKGTEAPKDAAERLEFARLCRDRSQHPAAARPFAGALAAPPPPPAHPDRPTRDEAARAAALAGGGRGQDVPPLPDAERARWRRQALDWLKAELADRSRPLAEGPDDARYRARAQLAAWKVDPALAP